MLHLFHVLPTNIIQLNTMSDSHSIHTTIVASFAQTNLLQVWHKPIILLKMPVTYYEETNKLYGMLITRIALAAP